MAQTNYTPISLYYSTTTTAVPVNTNLANGELAINITDGKLFYKDNGGTVQVIGWKTTPTTAGGTGLTTYTTGDLLYASATNTLSKLAAGSNGYVLTLASGVPTWAASTGGVTSFNAGTTGFTPNTATTGAVTLAGTLGTANGGTNLTTFTSGGAVYATSTSVLTTGTLPNTAGGTGQSSAFTQYGVTYASTTTALATTAVGTTGQVLTANTGAAPTFQTPASGVSLSANNTWTGTQTFNGSSSIFGTVLLDSAETVNVVASAPSSTTNFYVQSGSVQYYTTSAANNWTLNIAFSSGTSMNTALATGQSVTFALVTTQGSTAYYNSAVTIDGTSVTPKWIGGAPTAGNASGLDVYRFAVIKTASATYTVLASLTQFK